jgi:hypothetical protein
MQLRSNRHEGEPGPWQVDVVACQETLADQDGRETVAFPPPHAQGSSHSDAGAGLTVRGEMVRALAGYAVLLFGVVASLLVLSLLVDDRTVTGRIVWLGAGLLLGSLLAVRSRLPLLRRAPAPVAVGGWLGLILAAVLVVAAAPRSLSSDPTDAAERRGAERVRPAPPTAVVRTGTVGPTHQPTPVGSAVSPAAPPAPLAPASSAAVADTGPVDLTPNPLPIGSPISTAGRSLTSARATPLPTPALPAGFSPDRYLGQGNAYSCNDFGSQAEAQAVLRADPSDPNLLDQRRDGLACENNPPPRDTRRVPRAAP